jgi:gag-polypeptide of LTR copia-type
MSGAVPVVNRTPYSGLYSVERLNSTNYPAWKFRTELILKDRDLWKCIEPSSPSAKSAPSKVEEQSALAQIALNVSDEVIPLVRRATTAREAWKLVCERYEQKGLSARVFLRRKLFNIKYIEGESMQTHLNNIRDIADQLESIKAGIKDEDLAMTVLCSLPERFDSFIVQMEGRDITDLTFDFVSGRLLAEFTRQEHTRSGESNDGSQVSALYSKSQRTPRSKSKCTFCGLIGHTEERCWDKHGRPKQKGNTEEPSSLTAIGNFDSSSY